MSDRQSVELLLDEEERIEDDIAPLSDEAALRRRVERQIKKRGEFRSHLAIFIAVNLMFAAFFGALEIPWVAGVIALSWGSGLAAQGIDLYYDSGKRAAARLARMHQAYRDAFGPNWHERATPAQLKRIRKRVDLPMAKRREFLQHLSVFLCINLMLWFLYAAIMPDTLPWPALVTGFWGLGLAAHAANVIGGERTKQSIEREVERQRALIEEAQWGGEKPKNDFLVADDEPTLTVGPDGELIELVDEDEGQPTKRKRG